MPPLNLDQFISKVRFNCDVTDARHAGMYSVCGLVMRLRDLYKWEHRIPPWQEDDSDKVLAWIGDKETHWEALMTAEFQGVPMGGKIFDPFDTAGVNHLVNPMHLFYGAGYAHSLKPTFFLADIDDDLSIDGRSVRVLGREHARDLLTLPAFTQDGQVVLRTEAGRMYLWDQILYLANTGRRAFEFAIRKCGLEDSDPKTIRHHFDRVWKVQKSLYIRHEVGELEETVFDRDIWQQMLAAYPHTAVELFVRTLKDLLADTGDKGTLPDLIRHRNAAGLGLYMAFGNGITRTLTGPLACAFDDFMVRADWDRIAEASQALRQAIKTRTRQVMAIFAEGDHRQDLPWARQAIEEEMRQAGLIRK
jgi:hypothetical protein